MRTIVEPPSTTSSRVHEDMIVSPTPSPLRLAERLAVTMYQILVIAVYHQHHKPMIATSSLGTPSRSYEYGFAEIDHMGRVIQTVLWAATSVYQA